ncbi:MAG TPA: OmpA family protein, partial [Spirochaetota bacterium]|nr:OmpA family protein [Spirochaetota bacterium]
LDIPKMKTEFLVLNDNFKDKKNYQVNLKKNNTPNITDATNDALKENDTYEVKENDTYGVDDKNDAYEIVYATEDSIKKLLTAKVGDVVEFNNILFYPDDDRIMEESRPVLDEIVEILIKRKNIVIEIGGYTNSVGKFEDELELSMKRALKVALYLSGKGVEANRIKATGYGGIKGEGASEVKRKVEIKILKYK